MYVFALLSRYCHIILHCQQYILPFLTPTPTVLSTDGITIETRSTSFTVVTSGVCPAVQALACHIIAFIEDKVWV